MITVARSILARNWKSRGYFNMEELYNIAIKDKLVYGLKVGKED